MIHIDYDYSRLQLRERCSEFSCYIPVSVVSSDLQAHVPQFGEHDTSFALQGSVHYQSFLLCSSDQADRAILRIILGTLFLRDLQWQEQVTK